MTTNPAVIYTTADEQLRERQRQASLQELPLGELTFDELVYRAFLEASLLRSAAKMPQGFYQRNDVRRHLASLAETVRTMEASLETDAEGETRT